MPTNINAIKVCKLLYTCAIIYDLFIGLKVFLKKLQYFMILFHMYSTKFPKAANFHAHRCAPDARRFSHLVKFSKRVFFNTVKN